MISCPKKTDKHLTAAITIGTPPHSFNPKVANAPWQQLSGSAHVKPCSTKLVSSDTGPRCQTPAQRGIQRHFKSGSESCIHGFRATYRGKHLSRFVRPRPRSLWDTGILLLGFVLDLFSLASSSVVSKTGQRTMVLEIVSFFGCVGVL